MDIDPSHIQKQVNESTAGAKYSGDVKIEIEHPYADGFDIELTHKKATIQFDIELEEREWGLKDASLSIQMGQKVSVSVQKTEWMDVGPDKVDEYDVEVDLDKVKLECDGRSGGVQLGELVVYLGDDLKTVDYENTKIVYTNVFENRRG